MHDHFREKLERLRNTRDLVLYKWTNSGKKTAGCYQLSSMRLNVLTCLKGRVIFNIAAPVLYYYRALPVVSFRDSRLLTVLSGQRAGTLVVDMKRHEDETVTPVRGIGSWEITENSPETLKRRVVSMAREPCLPVCKILVPEFWRLSRKPEYIVPVFNRGLNEALGLKGNETEEEMKRIFIDSLNDIGVYTEKGYLIPFEYVAYGGSVVHAAAGITRSSGPVMSIPGKVFRRECYKKHWKLRTGLSESELNKEEEFNGELDGISGL